MTREEILQTFSDINLVYNNCSKYDTLKRMLDELTEPCEDCISRQAVLDTLDTSDKFMDEDRTVDTYKSLLKECYEVLPSVTPKQKMGHWEICEDADGIYGVCDICGKDADFTHYGDAYPYCPNCGAKMEESE